MNLGEGLIAAREIGARVDGEEKFLCTFAGWLEEPENPLSARFLLVAPEQRQPWEIYVDVNGRRFVREDHPSIDYLENGLLRQPGMRMFVVFDEGIFQNAPPITDLPEAEYRALFGRHPSFMRANSLDALAGRMGVDGATLRSTVEEFNRAVDAGRDERLGREFMVRRIERPPFYALGAGGITLLSPAGVAVNEKLQVVGQDGSPIPNLYAAGEVIGFTRLSGKGFAGGMSLTPALTFGRLLGQKLVDW
jgi:fumarate reductase flavoprotein subunit